MFLNCYRLCSDSLVGKRAPSSIVQRYRMLQWFSNILVVMLSPIFEILSPSTDTNKPFLGENASR